MKQIRISDKTMKQSELSLSFSERIELARLLDRLGVDYIELQGIESLRTDTLRIKSIASAVSNAGIAVPIDLTDETSPATVFSALGEAKRPRLQVVAPTGTAQIEYLYHKKPDAMQRTVEASVAACRALTSDVELVCEDATRADLPYLAEMIERAVEAGASTVTVSDTAGILLPSELTDFLARLREAAPSLSRVCLGISVSNTISMADASAIASLSAGAEQIAAAAYPIDTVTLFGISRVLSAKAETLGVKTSLRLTAIGQLTDEIALLCTRKQGEGLSIAAPARAATSDEYLTASDSESGVRTAAARLGYELSPEDLAQVFSAFRAIAEKKEKVSLRELDAIVAANAMQVPPTYRLDTYLITSSSSVSATAHIKLTKGDTVIEGVHMGDGSIDAAFRTVEKLTGRHFELDDFRLRAVTEGREAMAETLVKLRSGGRVYSGTGISTDVVGAGIVAYLNALNKIVYEEDER
jgi:2-isopropylmalate synthase